MKFQSDIPAKINDAVKRFDSNAEVIIYGSRARGDSKTLSDWDVLILLQSEKVTFATERELINLMYEIELDNNAVISPLIYSKSDWYINYKITPLFENITREGIIVA